MSTILLNLEALRADRPIVAQDHITIEDSSELVNVDLVKAGVGFGRGEKAGHKYWRRTRAIINGKLQWRYYYNTAADRQRYADDRERKRKRDNVRSSVRRAEKKLLRHAEPEVEHDAKLRSDFLKDHPELAAKRAKLAELNEDYLRGLFQWDKEAPDITASDAVNTLFGKKIEEHYGAAGDPADLHGEKVHWMRCVESATQLIPRNIWEATPGCIKSIDFRLGSEDAHLKKTKGWAAYAEWGGRICMGADRVHLSGRKGAGRGMKGDLFAVECMIHEMHHSIHNRMMKNATEPLTPGGQSWSSWEAFHASTISKKAGKGREVPITNYAETNNKEAFTESATATLMYPQAMAIKCPQTYDWFRKFYGPEHVRPRFTDQPEIERLHARLAATTDAEERSKITHLIDMAVGVGDMDENDPRLEWWNRSDKTPISKLVESAEKPNPGDNAAMFVDPSDPDAVGLNGHHDRFYEMAYRGRTLFMRVGPDGGDNGTAWDPASSDSSGSKVVLRPQQIKELYDENREPIDMQLAYWHLHQDLYSDPTEVVGEVTVDGKKVSVTVNDVFEHGLKRGGSDDRASGTEIERAVKQFVETKSVEKWMRTITANSYRAEGPGGKMAWRPATGGRGGGTASLESYAQWKEWRLKQGLSTDEAAFARDRELYAAQRAMLPQEVTQREFRQRSGAFSYDQIGLAGAEELAELKRLGTATERLPDGTLVLSSEMSTRRRELLEALAKKQPGLSRRMTRHKAGAVNDKGDKIGGQFDKSRIMVDSDGMPIFDRKRWVNTNPDGTQSVFMTRRGADGLHRLDDPMWSALLTPNGEHIESAAHLETLCRRAAARKAKTWVSVKTDRKRVRKGSGWVMEKSGDTGHYSHFEVEFDGSGQPRVKGSTWAKKTGNPAPRVDDLLQDDPIWSKLRDDARPLLEAEQIKLVPDKERDPNALPREGETILLDVSAKELPGNRKDGKTVVARLLRIVAGKEAGVIPDPPAWHDHGMPDQGPFAKGRLKKIEKELLASGVLPDDYVATAEQRVWFEETFLPLYEKWDETKEAEKDKFYPTQYVFAGETAGGAGRKRFIRYGEEALRATMSLPATTQVPRALREELLAYVHETVDARSGRALQKEVRLKLPADGSITAESLENMPGVDVVYANIEGVKIPEYVRVSLSDFAKFRTTVGGLSLTTEVNEALHERIEMLRDADARRQSEEHDIDLQFITPAWMADNWKAGLQKQLPNGADFELALHQQELLQKLIDNEGRVLAAHYMGTGKTVSAIAAAKIMMARPDPNDPSKLHPDNPRKVLIVAPLNTVEQWRTAAADFDDGALVVGSGANDIPIKDYAKMTADAQGDLVVVGPEYFTIHQAALKAQGFDGIIMDEVHQGVKNEDANRNKAVREWNPDMKMMMLLTGTPMTTSPADFVEYIRLLSNGKQWADMTAKQFTEMYLEPTTVTAALGGSAKGPKVQVKAEKRGELAAILAQWMHIALPKDVKGKVLPAVRVEENEHAHMTGVQAMLYNLYMATAGDNVDPDVLSPEELRQMGEDARRALSAAKSVANCPAYKPRSDASHIEYDTEVPGAKGKMSKAKKVFQGHHPDWLMDAGSRGDAAGKWPLISEMDPVEALIYDMYLYEVLGKPMSELAGKRIKKGELKRYKAWFAEDNGRIANPDAGPLGIRSRGSTRPWIDAINEQIAAAGPEVAAKLEAEKAERLKMIAEALDFQRAFRHEMEMEPPDGPHDELIARLAGEWGISFATAASYLATHPEPSVRTDTVSAMIGGKLVTVGKDERWFSDTTGSMHLLYRPEDVDENGKPRSRAGGWASVRPGDRVKVPSATLKALGIKKPKMPKGLSKEARAEFKEANANWEPPDFRAGSGEPDEAGNVPLIRSDTGETVYVASNGLDPIVASLMDPGMREERQKADIVMTAGNAKTDKLEEHIQRFHMDGGEGPDGSRQMVMFANGILDGCRTMEAKLRMMGFRDVNEVIEGSPHHDPTDTTTANQMSPNGKYFVTYIGATYTGDRELNVSIFQKVKDKLGQDSQTSLFVSKCEEPRPRVTVKATMPDGKKAEIEVNWMVYKGDTDDQGVRPSQWTPDQRAQIKAQFGIDAPESFIEVPQDDGTIQRLNFYGTKLSAQIMRDIVLSGDPTKLAATGDVAAAAGQKPRGLSPAEWSQVLAAKSPAEAVRTKIALLKAAYQTEALADIARSQEKTGAPPGQPLTLQQRTVFNNCEMIICSDAAQVGMNLGNAVEMVMYDSLSSPMAEMQRITRSARMLPPAVKAKLFGEPVMVPDMMDELDEDGEPTGKKVEVMGEDGKPIMVPKLDEKGRIVRTSTGPFGQIRDRERELFQARERTRKHGTIAGMQLAPVFPNAKKGEGLETFGQALERIRNGATDKATDAMTAGNKRRAAEWTAIANKASYAATLGGTAAREMLNEFKTTKTPGGTDNLIDYGAAAIKYTAPDSGTYEDAVSAEPIEAIRAAIETLSETDKQAILDAGYKGTDGDSHDPARIYMAIRASEILDWIEGQRPGVTRDMRAQSGGAVVTDNDVSNRLIDRLPPEDRAVLKTMKFLVNVQKIGVSAHVGQTVAHVYKNDDGEIVKETVHTGYEREHPVRTEKSTRATGRARHRSQEIVLDDVQRGIAYVPPESFATADDGSFSNVSRTNIAKSLFVIRIGDE